MTKLLFIFIAVLGLAGCAMRDSFDTPFSATNTPISSVKYCVPDAANKYDGTATNMTSGINSDASAWAQGGGCVLRPIREVWAVFNNLEEMRFVSSDEFSFTRVINPSADFTHLYMIRYTKRDLPLIGKIWWLIKWNHGLGGGTFLAPESVNINYQKIAGTLFMKLWAGGVVLTKVTDSVTNVTIRNTFLSEQQTNEKNLHDTVATVAEIIGHLRTGAPDWTRLNTGLKDNPDQPDPAPNAPDVMPDPVSSDSPSPDVDIP